MSGRNSQVARIYCVLDLLDDSQAGLTVAEIHKRLCERGHDASARTIYRDLEALAQAGFPLFPDEVVSSNSRSPSQRWRLDRNAKINQYLVLSAKELFALFLARGALTPLKATPFFDDLQNVFQKLEDKLGSRQIDYLTSLQSELKFEPGPQWGLGLNPEILETVRSACAEGHLLNCHYASVNSKKESERVLGPHYLYYARGGLYLVAEDLADHKVKVFAVPRMKQAQMLAESYTGNIETPDDVFQGSLGVFTGSQLEEVIIEFEPNVAQYVKERSWHSSQRTVTLTEGRVRVSLEVTQTPELFAWILGFGPNATVITPISLQNEIRNLAKQTADNYEKKAG